MTPTTDDPRTDAHQRRSLLVAGAAAVVVAGVGWWGSWLSDTGSRLFADAAPFHGRWRWLDTPGRFAPLVLAAALIVVWPVVSQRWSWRRGLVASWVAAFAWTVTLAASAGWDRIWGPLTSRYEYLRLARRLGASDTSVGDFLGTFVDRLADYPTHVRGHPPLPVLVLWFADRLGLSDASVGWATLALAASAAPAAVIAFDRVAGRDLALRALPFAGLAPAAVFMSSIDAVFMAVAAWATAALAIAVTTERQRVPGSAAAVAGLGFGVLTASSYGAPTLLGPAAAVALWAVWRRRWQPVAIASVVAVIPIAALGVGGFWWHAGFEATRAEYWKGFARLRPYGYFAVANLAVLAAVAGPAAVGGAALIRRRAEWLLVWGALAGAVLATLSGYSKGEVERIWLPLVPFVGLAAAALPGGTMARRGWLAAQLLVGLGLQLALGTPW